MHLLHDVLAAAQFSPEKMKKISFFESANLFCDLYCLTPGQAQTPHTHAANDKLYYAVSGTCRVQIGDAEHELAPGQLALAPAGVVHGVRNDSAENATLLVVMAPHPSFKG